MYSQINSNKRKTFIIMFFFLVIAGLLAWFAGFLFDDTNLAIIIVSIAVVYAVFSYFSASKMALAINGAHPIEQKDNPKLYRIVENLAITEGMPMPKVYLINDPSPNAFATGNNPKNAVVAATSGLVDMMSDQELEGVMAHELGHVKNYDIRVMMIVFALVTVIALMSDIILRMTLFSSSDDDNRGGGVMILVGLVALILAPIAAMMLKMSISRKREYLADATGALTTRYPDGLASALEKIAQYDTPLRRQNNSTAHLFFANPLKQGSISKLFSTHPPIEDRINRLREMGSSL